MEAAKMSFTLTPLNVKALLLCIATHHISEVRAADPLQPAELFSGAKGTKLQLFSVK
jgi:hypothetical protein